MNIITPLSTQPLASAQDVSSSDTSAAPASDFSSVLQQAEAAPAEATPAAPISPPPTPSTAQATERPSIEVAEQLEVAPQPELTDTPQAPAAPPVAITEQRTPVAKPVVDEVDDDPTVDVEHLPALPETATTEQDSTDDHDSTVASRDSLDAIRQRLDLIDNAGVLAMTAPVAWTPAPAATPEPVVEGETGYDSPAATRVEWPTADDESFALEPDLSSERPALPAPVALQAPVQAAQNTPTDSPPADTPDLPAPTADAGAALISATPSNPVSTNTQPVTAAPLGSTAWQADLGQQVVALVRRGDQQMDMQLNPADLGPLSISLNVSESGIQAQFQSAHASVRTAVEQALPQLQAALATQGLTLGEASINDGASRQAMGEQPRRESAGGGGTARAEPVAQAVVSQAPAVLLESVGSGVDLYL